MAAAAAQRHRPATWHQLQAKGSEPPRQVEGCAPRSQRARWWHREHCAGYAARDRLDMGLRPIPQNVLCFRYLIVTNETVTGY